MPQIDEEDRRDHDRRGGAFCEQPDHRELGRTRENEKAHRRDLDRLESRLPRDDPEGDADHDGGAHNGPAFAHCEPRRVSIPSLDQTVSASNSARRWPRSTCWPTRARTRLTVPSAGAVTRSSIFMASTTKSSSPRLTARSACAGAAMITPGIGATTSAPALCSTLRSRGAVSSSQVPPRQVVHTRVLAAAAAAGSPSTVHRWRSSAAATRCPAYS